MSDSTPVADHQLDARGLRCPQPLLLARRAMAGMVSGAVLLIHTDDPHALIDLEAWCLRFGHAYLGACQQGSDWSVRVRRA